MPTLPKPGENSFQPVPQGNHVAICYRVIDLGTQDGEYMGKKNRRHKLLVSWELPDEKMDDGRPFTIGKKYTWSTEEKASLRKDLESWRGKAFTAEDFGPNGFDIKNVIGVPCLLNVVHDKKGDKTYSNIASVARLPRGMSAPSPVNKPVYLWLSKEEFSINTFDSLSDNLKEAITQSPEYRALSEPERVVDEDHGAPRTLEDLNDEIPF